MRQNVIFQKRKNVGTDENPKQKKYNFNESEIFIGIEKSCFSVGCNVC
jgi:hypothetical protein